MVIKYFKDNCYETSNWTETEITVIYNLCIFLNLDAAKIFFVTAGISKNKDRLASFILSVHKYYINKEIIDLALKLNLIINNNNEI